MAVKTYKYNDTTQLSEHFKVSEFKCKCGGTHDILIDSDLVTLLEKVISYLNAKSCNIYSGYRCPTHDKNVGGNSSGPHTLGYAVDCYFLDQNGNRIPSSKVCLALEDLGHQFGIGYRCGGSADSTGNTHIDTKPRKWYGDESKSMSASCCTSFYSYFGIKKTTTNLSNITYQVYDNVKKKWLSNITVGEGTGVMSYAGNLGNSIGGLKIDNLKYRVHDKVKNKWLSWIEGRNGSGIMAYAGNLGNAIDGLQIENAKYRVHLKAGDWLPWIKKVDDTNQGYAGIYGKEIDAIQIK